MRAILDADPDDHDARLVYADFLQQKGDPRGELIAMQIRAARAMTDELWRAERALLDDHEKQWLGPWYGVARQWNFRLGFLHHVEARIDAFVEMASVIHAVEPLSDHLMHVRSLHLLPPVAEDVEPDVEKLVALASAIPLRLATLTIEHQLELAVARRYAAASMLSTVSTLRFQESRHDRSAFQIVVGSPYLDRLAALEFVDTGLLDDDARALATSPRYAQIRRLVVQSHDLEQPILGSRRRNQIAHAGARALVANGQFEYLDLDGHPSVASDVVDSLARMKHRLEHLGLAYASIDSLSAIGIRKLQRLRYLDVRHTQIDDLALGAILALPQLESVNLAHTRITADGVARILRHAPTSLRELTITVPDLDPITILSLSNRFKLHRWR